MKKKKLMLTLASVVILGGCSFTAAEEMTSSTQEDQTEMVEKAKTETPGEREKRIRDAETARNRAKEEKLRPEAEAIKARLAKEAEENQHLTNDGAKGEGLAQGESTSADGYNHANFHHSEQASAGSKHSPTSSHASANAQRRISSPSPASAPKSVAHQAPATPSNPPVEEYVAPANVEEPAPAVENTSKNDVIPGSPLDELLKKAEKEAEIRKNWNGPDPNAEPTVVPWHNLGNSGRAFLDPVEGNHWAHKTALENRSISSWFATTVMFTDGTERWTYNFTYK